MSCLSRTLIASFASVSARFFGTGSLALILFAATGSVAAERGEWTVYDDHARRSLYVPVRDGTRLAMNVYRPVVEGEPVADPLPVVFAFTPYRARYYDESGKIVETGRSERLALRHLTDAGYVVAVADVRGKGASFGRRRGFQDRTEARDGHDLVEWLAGQPWSNGEVGMTGCSYLGGSTLQVATTTPPSLKAVFIGASDFDKYTFVRRGGITAQFNTRPDEPAAYDLASVPVDDDDDGALLAKAVKEHAANTPMAALWYGMPFRDSESSLTDSRFWEEVGPYTYLNALRRSGIAYYFWGNWSDEPTEQILMAAANLPSRMLIGPGTHCEPSKEIDFPGEVRRFFDYHLKHIDNGLDREPRYKWRLQNVARSTGWMNSNTLPGDGLARKVIYLTAGREGVSETGHGGLTSERPSSSREQAFTVQYDLGEQEYFRFWPDSPDSSSVTFTAQPLHQDTAMVGFPIVDLAISIDREDANLFAYVEDVSPDDDVTVVSFGRLAASHRSLSKAPYENLGLPFHSGLAADVQPVTPGQMVRLRFALLPNAWVFKAGHRIRLAIAGADPRQRNLASIAEEPPPRITIYLGAEGASLAELPLVDPTELTGGMDR